MFIYNFKINKTKIFKIFLVIICIILLIMFLIAGYKIISNSLKEKQSEIPTLTTNNYTDVLKMVHNNIDNYVGQKINFSGYVFRAPDFTEDEFVLARNMIINNQNQFLVVGFLCNSNEIKKYADNTWIEVTGEITKGSYNGEIPVLKVLEIKQIEKPQDEFVYPPDDSYIPTSLIL